MAGNQRRAGLIQLQVNGEVYDAKGTFTYNLGTPKREAIIGADRVHGYKEMPQVAFIEGAITDSGNLDLAKLASIKNATVTLDLANDKKIVLRNAWFAGEATGNTDEGEVSARFEGAGAEEVKA